MNNYQSSNQHVHGWLNDIPGYRENYRNERQLMIQESEKLIPPNHSLKERPSSLASISSEDSINLEELINANFTTDMIDETDLSALASLELDDSNEDFWKVDNMYHHYIPPSPYSGKKLHDDSSNRSKYESDEEIDSKNTSSEDLHEVSLYNLKQATDLSFLDGLNFTAPIDHPPQHELSRPKIPLSLSTLSPLSPLSPADQQRSDRSGSFSSENSLTSQSTVTTARNRNIYPSSSTSTSSMSSHSTAKTSHSSYLSRSVISSSDTTNNKMLSNSNSRLLAPQPSRKPSLISSLSENTQQESGKLTKSGSSARLPTRTGTQLTRRATHIPAPSNKTTPTPKVSLVPTPQRTKSTASLAVKTNNNTLSRSASRIGSTRASHIPSPPARSTTSLGISSIFQQKNQQKSINNANDAGHHQQARPKTSMGSLKPSPSSHLLRSSGLRTPTLSKSSSLRKPHVGSRSLYM